MPGYLSDISKLLGTLGTVAGILGGAAGIVPYLQPKPAVQLWIEKAQVSGIPALGNDPNSVKETPEDFGAVTVAIRNNSPTAVPAPTLQFRNLHNFKGIVIADRSREPGEAQRIEQAWNREIVSYREEPTINLPPLNPGAGIIVQAFGSNWKNVDPEFTGAYEYRKIWVITVVDSRTHKYLFEYHLWILSLVAFIAGCVLLVIGRTSASGTAPHSP